MKLLTAVAALFIAAGVCLEPYPVDAASKYDGTVPFLCVPTAVAECVAEGECRPGTAESENFRTSSRSISRRRPFGPKTRADCHRSNGSTAAPMRSRSTARRRIARGC
jgi:hypothetical protein